MTAGIQNERAGSWVQLTGPRNVAHQHRAHRSMWCAAVNCGLMRQLLWRVACRCSQEVLWAAWYLAEKEYNPKSTLSDSMKITLPMLFYKYWFLVVFLLWGMKTANLMASVKQWLWRSHYEFYLLKYFTIIKKSLVW